MNDFYTLYYIMYMLWPNICRNICYIIAQLKFVCIRVCNTTGVTSGAGTLHGGKHVDTYYIVIVNLECSVEIFVIVQLSFAYLRHICLTMKTLISNKYLCWWTISPGW